ncbi:MAG: HAMP domain-containing histidine kinase [Proteobacteria bacterium]|nr:HAMP domain-containing histidine kinase [Pseudomonadota bacterium]
MNLRTKIAIWFNAFNVLVLFFFAGGMYLGITHSVEEGINNRLYSTAEATYYIIEKPLSTGNFAITTKDFENILRAFLGFSGAEGYVRIVRDDGKVISATQNVFFQNLKLDYESIKILSSNREILRDFPAPKGFKEKKIRVLFYPIVLNGKLIAYIEVASSLQRLENIQSSIIQLFLIIIPVALAISNIGGLFIFNRGLKPLSILNKELKNISAKNPTKLPRWDKDDEFRELFESINDMLDRFNKTCIQTAQFSADASHELRTPLTIIKGLIEVSLRSERTVEEYQDTLVSILEEIERMVRIVEDLLLISKSEAGEVLIEKREVNIKTLLTELCEQLSFFAEDKNIELIYTDIEDIIIMADALRLRQVFTNLIENAIKYNKDQGKVFVYTKRENEGLSIYVEDTGIGIKEEDIPHIFDRFFRADKSRKREIGGAGLGLSICKWIIEGHNGYINVSSRFGEGTTFKVWLPFK